MTKPKKLTEAQRKQRALIVTERREQKIRDLEQFASDRNLTLTKLGNRYYFLPKDAP